tara:strand:- start:1697 stop:1912 length:216 start_codon:yes stop_codon:yes gene_type:complete
MVKARFIGEKKYNSNFVWFHYNEETKVWLVQEGINHNTSMIYPYGQEVEDNKINEIMNDYKIKDYKIKENI